MTFEQYYNDNCTKLVLQLAKKIGNLEEAEDRVQNIFMSLLPRKEFCGGLMERGELEKYIQGAMNRQSAQIYREQSQQVPTTSIDIDNIDFLSSIRANDNDWGMSELELNDFYDGAKKLLDDSRKLPSKGFETVGELRQYIFVQYCQNGKTFREIGELVGLSLWNISVHYKRIVTILTPFIINFLWGKSDDSKNDLTKSENLR